jgi:CarboxypepD_reg-like domain/TonB-dependent Receptor Plug Domain
MKSFTAFLIFILLSILAQAQTQVSGKVTTTKGEAVIGANVRIGGTYDGNSSDTAGNFIFKTDATGAKEIIVTYVGCDTLRTQIGLNGSAISLTLQIKERASGLHEVVIAAGAYEASDEKKSVVLKPLDIAMTASATADIAGALMTLPGVQRNGESGHLLVRGGGEYETRTFIDGLLVQNPYNSSVPNLPSRNRFSPFMFKGTIFSTGGYSAEYGQAMSSALILNTTDLAAEDNSALSIMSLGLSATKTKRWENTSLSVSGTYINLSPYQSLVPQTTAWIKAPQQINSEISLRHKTSPTGMFKFYLTGSNSSMKLDYPNENDASKSDPISLNANNIYLNSSYKEQFGKWTFFAGTAATYNNDKIDQLFNIDTKTQSVQIRSSASRMLNDDIKIKLGAEYLYSQFDMKFRSQDNISYSTLLNDNYASAFVESDIYLSSKLLTRVGVRVENSSLLNKSNLAPRFSLAYLVGKTEQISLAYGQFYQNPENNLMRRNHDLAFEQADHFMLNYQKMWKNRIFRVEAYYKNYANLVKIDSKTNLSNNNGNGYAQGIDVFFKDSKTIKNGDFWISYSYLDTRRDYRDFPTPAIPTFASAHNASVVYKHWLPKQKIAIGATYSFTSARPYNDPNTTQFNSGRTPLYHDVSVNLAYLTSIKGNFTILYFSCTNILGLDQVYGYKFGNTPDPITNRYNSTTITNPAKRNIFVGVFINFGKKFEKNKENNDDL